MQVARNFFLSSEKTYTRKIYEMLLAYKIERALTKDQILEVYMNQIYLGQRAYGFASAARVYFGKDLKDITLAEAAMLAGLPKAPSAYNPVVNPKRAKMRQEYILQRMLELHYITPGTVRPGASKQPTRREGRGQRVQRARRVRRGNGAPDDVRAVSRRSLHARPERRDHDRFRRSGRRLSRGAQRPDGLRAAARLSRSGRRSSICRAMRDDREQAIDDALARTSRQRRDHRRRRDGGESEAGEGELHRRQRGDDSAATVCASSQIALSSRAQPNQRIRPGAIVRLVKNDDGNWIITQLPQVEGAFVSVVPQDGAIRALVGGFDFNKNKFNHVTQAWRQPGSSFKPFIYSASLEKGLGPATIINDAPLFFSAAETGGQAWEPKNYGGGFDGPMSMRTALQRRRTWCRSAS